MSNTIKLSVPDMSCGHCKASVEKALGPMASDVSVDLSNRQVTVKADSAAADLIKALDAIGFPATAV